MKGQSNRQKKFNRMIQKELGELFQQDFRLPAGVMLTVTGVTCSPDLQYVKVYLSFFPDEKSEEIMGLLEDRKWEVRKILASRIRNVVRFVPELNFFVDDSAQVAAEMDRLFDSLKKEEE